MRMRNTEKTYPDLTQHGVHGREGDPLPQPLHDPDGDEEVDAGPGRPGGEEGEEGGDEDPQAVQPLAAPQLRQPPPRHLCAHVPVEEGAQYQTLHNRKGYMVNGLFAPFFNSFS